MVLGLPVTYQRLLTVLSAALLLLLGCAPAPSPPSSITSQAPHPPALPVDQGDVGHFHDCSAEPRRALSVRERCEISALKARCTALDDCLVTCLSSPDGVFLHHGCGGVCTLWRHRPSPLPKAIEACESVPGDSGLLQTRRRANNPFRSAARHNSGVRERPFVAESGYRAARDGAVGPVLTSAFDPKDIALPDETAPRKFGNSSGHSCGDFWTHRHTGHPRPAPT